MEKGELFNLISTFPVKKYVECFHRDKNMDPKVFFPPIPDKDPSIVDFTPRWGIKISLLFHFLVFVGLLYVYQRLVHVDY